MVTIVGKLRVSWDQIFHCLSADASITQIIIVSVWNTYVLLIKYVCPVSISRPFIENGLTDRARKFEKVKTKWKMITIALQGDDILF